MINHTLKKQKCLKEKSSKYFFVKEVVLPFNKFENSNLILGPEMKSTGEVMGIGKKFSHAFYKALQSTVSKILIPGLILCIIPFQNLKKIFKICKKFINLGFIIDFVSKKIYKFLENSKLNLHHINCLNLKKIYLKEILKNKKYVYIINIPDFSQKKNYNKEIFQYIIQNQIHYDTTLKGVYATYGAFKNHDKINVYSIQQIQCR